MDKRIGDRIKNSREAMGIRQVDLAKLTGVSRDVILRTENGYANTFDPAFLIRLADLFDVSIDYLLCREVKNKDNSECKIDNEYLIQNLSQCKDKLKKIKEIIEQK